MLTFLMPSAHMVIAVNYLVITWLLPGSYHLGTLKESVTSTHPSLACWLWLGWEHASSSVHWTIWVTGRAGLSPISVQTTIKLDWCCVDYVVYRTAGRQGSRLHPDQANDRLNRCLQHRDGGCSCTDIPILAGWAEMELGRALFQPHLSGSHTSWMALCLFYIALLYTFSMQLNKLSLAGWQWNRLSLAGWQLNRLSLAVGHCFM